MTREKLATAQQEVAQIRAEAPPTAAGSKPEVVASETQSASEVVDP